MKKLTTEDYWLRVEKTETCWLWGGPKLPSGYGMFGRQRYAHRYAYEMAYGPITLSLHIDHLCFVRHCVNPEHLEAVSQAENNRRMAARKTHCPHGHEYNEENTRMWGVHRQCRACDRIKRRKNLRPIRQFP